MSQQDAFAEAVFFFEGAEIAAEMHYAEFEAHCEAMLECRGELARHLEARGFEIQPPAGHFILAKHPAHTGDTLHDALLSRGVAVRLFPGGLTDPYIRITVPPRAEIDAFVEVLDDLLAAESPARQEPEGDPGGRTE